MPITTTIDSEPWVPTGSPSEKDRKELGEVLDMWTSISPVCTVSTERHDQWHHDLLWRGHNFGLITQGMGMIGFTSKVCVSPLCVPIDWLNTVTQSSSPSPFTAITHPRLPPVAACVNSSLVMEARGEVSAHGSSALYSPGYLAETI